MAPVNVDPAKVREFVNAADFYDWLSQHHDSADEIWIKIHKKGSGLPTISAQEAIDVVLCWGWIDGIRKGFDKNSFLQRYTPRRPKSIWSRVNVENVARLIEEGRMTEHGLRQVEAAKADGRWEKAYSGSRDMEVPDDFLAALESEPGALAMFEQLNAQNRFAFLFRLHNLKTEAGRRKRIADSVQMLARGETIYPQELRNK